MEEVTDKNLPDNQTACVDRSINADLVDTRGEDDVLAPFMVKTRLVSFAASWINTYHGSYNISSRREAVKYIVVHYVGSGTSTPGNAKNNCIYFSGGNRNASAHYFIDDGGIWEYADPDSYYTWHVGDGHGMYGITNSNSVGIEVCIDGDQSFTPNEIGYLTQLVTHLMGKYNVPASRVVRHYDASRKQCPYWYAGTGIRQQRWNELHSTITQEADMTPDQSAKLDTLYNHIQWDENHFSNMGNLIAQMPLTYQDGTTASLGDRLCYIDQQMHVLNDKLDALSAKLH